MRAAVLSIWAKFGQIPLLFPLQTLQIVLWLIKEYPFMKNYS
jgi:hypothetical protein